MNKTKQETQDELLNKAFDKLRKDGLIVDVIGQDGIVTMLTAKGFEQHKLLSLFTQANQTNPLDPIEKPKKSGQEKMDSAIKTMVQVGAGISQLMQGIGKMAGDPVKMDMSQAGFGFGDKTKQKKRKTTKKKRKYKQ
jgi:hypothetical protein